MRPSSLAEILGQDHLLAPDKPLARALASGRCYSMLLWGPPGSGKTTLARVIAHCVSAPFVALSAVLSGVAEIRHAVADARAVHAAGRRTILFVDEIHRFNKAQQDALLPHVEDGTLTLIGATTENPSFSVNSALLSRVRVHVLQPLGLSTLSELLRTACTAQKGLALARIPFEPMQLQALANASDGDTRRALTLLELAFELLDRDGKLPESAMADLLRDGYRRFDREGDLHYDQISALHKCIRNSHPDAALYWLCRMLDGGVDPNFLARRLVRAASEDIGNADPRALAIALDAWQAFERLGAPEGELALAQATLYLACAAKSNASYTALKAAQKLVAESSTSPVPIPLRNAPTSLLRSLGHGAAYVYDHDLPEGIAFAQQGFPPELEGSEFYHPVARGLETQIAEKLRWIRERRALTRSSPD